MVYLLYVTFDEEIDYEYPFRKKENKKEKWGLISLFYFKNTLR
jgi:hypothetical protein